MSAKPSSREYADAAAEWISSVQTDADLAHQQMKALVSISFSLIALVAAIHEEQDRREPKGGS